MHLSSSFGLVAILVGLACVPNAESTYETKAEAASALLDLDTAAVHEVEASRQTRQARTFGLLGSLLGGFGGLGGGFGGRPYYGSGFNRPPPYYGGGFYGPGPYYGGGFNRPFYG